jgi:threonine dehydratase
LNRVRDASRVIDPVFLRSPQYVCEPLTDALGVRVLLKVETMNPIRCFKGRGAEYFVSRACAGERLVCASAGNFGQAMAYSCRKRGIPLTVYAGVGTNELKLARIAAMGAQVVLEGEDFDAAKIAGRRASESTGARWVEDGLEPEIAEGAGTIGFELIESVEAFDAVVVPVGNGALICGIGCVMKACRPGVQVIGVQSVGAPAMVESWRSGRIVTYDSMDTIADGIGVRVPIAEAVEDMRALVDDTLLVREESIRRAMLLVHEHAGLAVEPSGAAAVATLLDHAERFRGRAVSVIICGGNLTAEQMYRWL